MPAHFDPATVGEVWRVQYEELARDAEEWAQEHEVEPAVEDAFRICLVTPEFFLEDGPDHIVLAVGGEDVLGDVVVQEQGRAHARRLRDGTRRGAGHAAGPEEFDGGLQNALPHVQDSGVRRTGRGDIRRRNIRRGSAGFGSAAGCTVLFAHAFRLGAAPHRGNGTGNGTGKGTGNATG